MFKKLKKLLNQNSEKKIGSKNFLKALVASWNTVTCTACYCRFKRKTD
jgi:PHP family Zn ribbon phosphoesterase